MIRFRGATSLSLVFNRPLDMYNVYRHIAKLREKESTKEKATVTIDPTRVYIMSSNDQSSNGIYHINLYTTIWLLTFIFSISLSSSSSSSSLLFLMMSMMEVTHTDIHRYLSIYMDMIIPMKRRCTQWSLQFLDSKKDGCWSSLSSRIVTVVETSDVCAPCDTSSSFIFINISHRTGN